MNSRSSFLTRVHPQSTFQVAFDALRVTESNAAVFPVRWGIGDGLSNRRRLLAVGDDVSDLSATTWANRWSSLQRC
jgi:hypothetical protein